MEKEQQFDTLQDFKNALENWSVAAKFRYRVKKTDKYAVALYSPNFQTTKHLQTYSRNVLSVDSTELKVSLYCRRPILNRPRDRPKERRIRKGEKQRKRLRQQAAGGLGDTYYWLYTALLGLYKDRS